MSGDCLSVVVPTHERPAMLERLLRQLAAQTLAPELFEVVVVDDGSASPARGRLCAPGLPVRLRVEEQANAGAAAARHRGALAASGEVLVFLDDDMQVGPGFLEAHRARHLGGSRKVVLGRIHPGVLRRLPLFERWHAAMFDWLAEELRAGRRQARGDSLYSGNVSLRRDDYLATGGFDPGFALSEDVELGLRLERAGLRFELAEEAYSLHESDHESPERWLRRCFLYGVHGHRILRKHPRAARANPWRGLFDRHPASRPLLAVAVASPRVGGMLSRLAFTTACALDLWGARRAAYAGVSLVFGLEYCRGAREEAGSLVAVALDLIDLAGLDGAPSGGSRGSGGG